MDTDMYLFTDAELLDTLQFVVQEEKRENQNQQIAKHIERTANQSLRIDNAQPITQLLTREEMEHQKVQPTKSIGDVSLGFDYDEDIYKVEPQMRLYRLSSTSSTDSATSQQTSLKISKPINPYHNRQKQELKYLKSKVSELEKELQRLEHEYTTKLAEVGDSIWQRVAHQQTVELQKSMSENARLKEILVDQIKFAHSLEHVIRKRPNLSAFGYQNDDQAQNIRRRRKYNIGANSSTTLLYDELEAIAIHEHGRVNDIMKSSGALEIHSDQRIMNLQIVDDENSHLGYGLSNNVEPFDECENVNNVARTGELRVEWITARRFPFHFQAVGQQLWRLLSLAGTIEQGEGINRTVDITNDALFTTTVAQFPIIGSTCTGTLTASAVMRQSVEEDKVTLIWVSDGECEAKKSMKNTFKLFEIGWVIILPTKNDPNTCIARSVGYYSPRLSVRNSKGIHILSTHQNTTTATPLSSSNGCNEESADTSDEIAILTDLISSVYDKGVTQMNIALENALLTEQLERK